MRGENAGGPGWLRLARLRLLIQLPAKLLDERPLIVDMHLHDLPSFFRAGWLAAPGRLLGVFFCCFHAPDPAQARLARNNLG